MIRAKCKYYEDGEKPTKYFCSLEKRNYTSKIIRKLSINDNVNCYSRTGSNTVPSKAFL